jgi:hypothetical protein
MTSILIKQRHSPAVAYFKGKLLRVLRHMHWWPTLYMIDWRSLSRRPSSVRK